MRPFPTHRLVDGVRDVLVRAGDLDGAAAARGEAPHRQPEGAVRRHRQLPHGVDPQHQGLGEKIGKRYLNTTITRQS